jgi:hypothetical protein
VPDGVTMDALRVEPTLGMSVWRRDHAGHQTRMLMSPDVLRTIRVAKPSAATTEVNLEALTGNDPLP